MKRYPAIFFIIILIICTFVYIYNLYLDKPSFNNAEKINIYLDGTKDEKYNHILKNNQIYISAEYLLENELLDFDWYIEQRRISIYNDFKFETIKYNKKKAYFHKQPYDTEEILTVENNKLFFNTSFIKENYIASVYIDSVNLNVIIEKNIREYKVVKKSKLKSAASKTSFTSMYLNAGESIYVYKNELNGYILARTQNNKIGFVKISDIKPISKISYNIYPSINKGKSIYMAWDLVYQPSKNFKPFNIPDTVDIISPTWYSLKEDCEFFEDFSNDDYIEHVRKSKKEIWGVFSNSFDPDLTSKLLNNSITRGQIADRIIEITEEKNYDAINLDFENIYLKDKNVLSAFIKELYCKAKEKSILMTVDITIMSKSENWSLCYDRKVIGKYSDYIMLMAYDENVSGIPGSVASLPWVEYGVKNILEYAPNEKVVLSVPFYTRLWEKVDNEKIKSTALKIISAKKAIDELQIELKYDEATGQNYGEKTIDSTTYMIWNEDEISLQNRIDIAKRYNLAGYAVWALSYGTDGMWSMLR